MIRSCLTCQAYKVDDGDDLGSCQLHPPVLVGDGFMFPGVHPLAWCLDWQPKEEGTPFDALQAKMAPIIEALESLCHAVERGETDDDYLRTLAEDGRWAITPPPATKAQP